MSQQRLLSRTSVMAAAAGGALILGMMPAHADTPREFATPPGHHFGKVVFPERNLAVHAAGAASGTGRLIYGGAVDNIGVTTGTPKVYLVFYGSQWGTQSTDANGNAVFSGDSKGVAPRLQQMFKGLGTNNETWSGVMTQYCEGVAPGATSCPSSAAHVGYPTGGALAGIWEDTSALSPSKASGHQLALEAIKGAGHFGNTTSTSNRNAQYVVVSPHGTHPDGFNTWYGNFCAWHDYNGDNTLSGGAAASSYGDIAFTNLPYIPDMGTSCGANYVNGGSAGTLDGVTIVGGHEYAETITDQNPAGGWTDSSGYENADKCAWNGVGGTGGAQNIAFATGSFAMQATYSNDVVGCQISHAIVGGSTTPPPVNTVTVNGVGNQTGTAGTAIAPLQMTATDSGNLVPTFTASGLPAGLSISPGGLITGTPTTAGTYSTQVTATDTTGGTGSTSFTWTVNTAPVTPNTVTVNPVANQTGTAGTAIAPLQMTATDSGNLTPTFSATGLPTGLSITTAGLISGTPTTAGTYSTKVTATDTTGGTGSTSFTWTVNTAPVTPNTVTVSNPGNQSSTVGTALTLQMSATDSGNLTPTFSATGLPPGLTISTNGTIGGTPTTAGSYSTKVTASDTTGGSGSATFTWSVTAPTTGCTPKQLLGNPGFETGTAAPWSATSGVIDSSTAEPAHSGSWKAWLDGYGFAHTDTLSQTVTLPTSCSTYSFSFWLHIDTAETTTTYAYDTLKVQAVTSYGTITLATYSNLDHSSGYLQKTFNLAPFAGTTMTLKFVGTEDSSLATSFVVDDTAFNVS